MTTAQAGRGPDRRGVKFMLLPKPVGSRRALVFSGAHGLVQRRPTGRVELPTTDGTRLREQDGDRPMALSLALDEVRGGSMLHVSSAHGSPHEAA